MYHLVWDSRKRVDGVMEQDNKRYIAEFLSECNDDIANGFLVYLGLLMIWAISATIGIGILGVVLGLIVSFLITFGLLYSASRFYHYYEHKSNAFKV